MHTYWIQRVHRGVLKRTPSRSRAEGVSPPGKAVWEAQSIYLWGGEGRFEVDELRFAIGGCKDLVLRLATLRAAISLQHCIISIKSHVGAKYVYEGPWVCTDDVMPQIKIRMRRTRWY